MGWGLPAVKRGYGGGCIYGAGYRVKAPRLGGNGRWREGMCEGHVGAARGTFARAKMDAPFAPLFPYRSKKRALTR